SAMAPMEPTEPTGPPPQAVPARQASASSTAWTSAATRASSAARTRRPAVMLVALFMTQQIEELLAHLALVENAAQRGGHRLRPGLLDAAHLDAEVPRLNYHHRSLRLQLLLEERDDLLGEALLQLRALGVELEDARELGQAEDTVARDVGDVRMAVERHQVMGAQRVEGDPLLHHHVAVAFLVGEGGDLGLRSLGEALEHLEVHPGHPEIGLGQVRIGEIQVQRRQDAAHVEGDPLRDRPLRLLDPLEVLRQMLGHQHLVYPFELIVLLAQHPSSAGPDFYP